MSRKEVPRAGLLKAVLSGQISNREVGTFEQASNPKGRLPIITGPQIRELIDITLSSPAERGLPFSTWTMPKLAEDCRQRGPAAADHRRMGPVAASPRRALGTATK